MADTWDDDLEEARIRWECAQELRACMKRIMQNPNSYWWPPLQALADKWEGEEE